MSLVDLLKGSDKNSEADMKTVILSAGHYPAAKGACHGEFCEYDEAVRWVRLTEEYLDGHAKVVVVPGTKLRDKVKYINRHQGHLVVEIHFNACGGCGAKGSETLYMPGSTKGELCARRVQDQLASVFAPNRGVKEGWYRMDRPGIVDYRGDVDGDEQPDYILRKTKWPAIIVEPEFIHNQKEVIQKREEGCQALATGILNALGAV